jgi:hypothetical protein
MRASILASVGVYSSLGIALVKYNINTLTRVESSNYSQFPYRFGENVDYLYLEMHF